MTSYCMENQVLDRHQIALRLLWRGPRAFMRRPWVDRQQMILKLVRASLFGRSPLSLAWEMRFWSSRLSVCPEMIFFLEGHFCNKIFDSGYCPRISLTPFAVYIWKEEFNISWLFF